MATRITRVEDVVNMRDLALGVNDWYNVTPSIRRAMEGFASILQEQAAHLERVDAALGLAPPGAVPPTPGVPGTPGAPQWAQTPAAPRPLVTVSSASDVGALAERVDHLTQELATAKAKLRALETARSGDVLSDIAERACALATSRAETAAREATAAARDAAPSRSPSSARRRRRPRRPKRATDFHPPSPSRRRGPSRECVPPPRRRRCAFARLETNSGARRRR